MNIEKRCKSEHFHRHNCTHNNCRRSPSSYGMHNPELVFQELKLKEGEVFLDLGCGVGDYSIHASKIVGESGMVYALDTREDLLNGLDQEAVFLGLKNIRTKASDIRNQFSIEDGSVDVCFIATVLHMFDLDREGENIFSEIRRILKSMGRLAIIECKKEDMPFGPPMNMRKSPDELEKLITPYGFKKIRYVNFKYNYMIQFGIK